MKNRRVSRADLLRVLAGLEDEAQWARFAATLGFDLEASPVLEPAPSRADVPPTTVLVADTREDDVPILRRARKAPEPVRFAPVPLLQAVRLERKPETQPMAAPGPGLSQAQIEGDGPHRELVAPRIAPLVPWSRLRQRVFGHLAIVQPVRRTDLKRFVRQVASCRPPKRLPRKTRSVWPPRVFVLMDRMAHLAPMFPDQEALVRGLSRELPRNGLELRALPTGPETAWTDPLRHRLTRPTIPFGAAILVSSDLGCTNAGGRAADEATGAAAWERFGARFASKGHRLAALVPLRQERIPEALRRLLGAEPWDRRDRRAPEEAEEAAARILDWLSSCERLTPGLVRAFSRTSKNLGTGPEIERAVWSHPSLRYADALGCTPSARREPIDPAAWGRDGVDPKAFFELLRAWHRHLPPEVWHMTVLDLARRCDPDRRLLLAEDQREAEDFLARWLATRRRDEPAGEAAQRAFLVRRERRNLATVEHDPVLFDLLHLDLLKHPERSREWTVDPERLERLGGAQGGSDARSVMLVQASDGLRVRDPEAEPAVAASAASPVAWISSTQPWVALGDERGRFGDLDFAGQKVVPVAAHPMRVESSKYAVSIENLTLSRLPAWASAVGRDRFGLWCEVELAGVRFRMRWIPPGGFWMGSPEDEPGHWGDEGPRHWVTLTEGYWLAEAPCTQELWKAVTNRDPSRFQNPERPVEQVSWDDVEGFLKRTEELQPGLGLRLPTEAQWEYACRAGGTDDRYQGGWKILGERNAPALDEIAWYGGNSGVEFDLAEGQDSRKWREKQYPHEKAGTRRVKTKAPNAWGLYDMLGNVWEWCRDGQRRYVNVEEMDPVGPQDLGSKRVLRGGSWYGLAGYVRPAGRHAYSPGFADGYLGVRLSRGHALGSSEGGGADRARVEAGQAQGGDRPERGPLRPGRVKAWFDRFRGR